MNEPAWVEHAIWWQVYPLGFVGAFPADPPPSTDEHRMRRIVDWFDHAVALGASGIALGPVFASHNSTGKPTSLCSNSGSVAAASNAANGPRTANRRAPTSLGYATR